MAISEEEKYKRKQGLLTRALEAADKMDAADEKRDKARAEKEKTGRAAKRQTSREARVKEQERAKKDGEPVLG